ncbi:unnamed protein product [Macrosiphum euphorbiae]|uniref:Secreted protein n=1 Tax=Macrosiphum euphorbiae TaxID=13131 RepID=A0AAV0WEH2_9HEMI|nr:unnamed protein product [Macrosiphum euphorbiae]
MFGCALCTARSILPVSPSGPGSLFLLPALWTTKSTSEAVNRTTGSAGTSGPSVLAWCLGNRVSTTDCSVAYSIEAVFGGPLSLRITSLYGLPNGSASTEEISSFQHVFLLRRMAIFNCLLASRYAPLVKASSASARSSSNSWAWRRRSLDTQAVTLVIRRLALVKSARRASMSAFHQ